ncbi:hypothetical protein CCUG60885_04217 [Mycobacteroides salmoniphilum]|uniref:Uncharacterized protein n=1 Tax=Mycobacteroides salmoniphilum TaxID=404941 RepID=A0A4R8SBZ0_9MYCO|nr:hypothetical protein CCUG60885_04217 [Mycobacteroides salmoniphilum]TEA07333.1 hypothetical protein CCUG60883_01366 [Mycobacteroides salmoniphilum]
MTFPHPPFAPQVCTCKHFRYQHDSRGVDSQCYAMEDGFCDCTEYRELPKDAA